MEPKFKVPTSYEEAVLRRDELLEKLNQYNDEYLSDKPTTLSEQELADIQEEYQYLEDVIVVDKKDKRDVTVVENENFFDHVNIIVWLYAILAFFSAFYFVQELVGFEFVKLVYGKGMMTDVSNTALWFMLVACYIVYPLAVVIVATIIKIFAFRKGDNKKAFTWVYFGQIAFLLINLVITYFTSINLYYQMLRVE